MQYIKTLEPASRTADIAACSSAYIAFYDNHNDYLFCSAL